MSERVIQLEEIIEAPAAEVWTAWTTVAGLRTFLAPDAVIDVRPGGTWEIRFLPEAPEGSRGSEGCRVLAVSKGRDLTFEWNFVPGSPIRHEKTRVTVEIHPFGASQCHVVLLQEGWREGPDWDAGFEYFSRAWSLVLARLERSFREGPIDWVAPWTPPG